MQFSSDKLERVANAAIIVAAVACMAAWGSWYVKKPTQPNLPATIKYSAGDSLAKVAELENNRQEPTLLLFVSPNCPYCTDSMPFYKSVIDSDTANRVRIVFGGREHTDDLREYLGTHGVPIERVEIVRFRGSSEFRQAGTPALFLLDSQRRIQHVWTGKLKPEGELAVMAALRDRSGLAVNAPR